MASSKIEWTESTWNPVTGCTKISAGCKNCYAERMAKRLKLMGQPNYKNGFKVTLHEKVLEYPLSWKKPKTIFVNSMSDLFHEKIPTSFIKKVFDIMKRAHWHKFQVLTKRSNRLKELASQLYWPENVWMGVTVENTEAKNRIDDLRNVPSAIRFISFEPLLEFLGYLNLKNINWIIVGGESGAGARPMKKEWVKDIKRQCINENIPFFFKQWGGVNKKKSGRILDGQIWDNMPNILKKNNDIHHKKNTQIENYNILSIGT